MGQKFAAYNASGAITAFYDSIDSPVPSGVIAIEITDAQWQECLATPGYTVANGDLVAPAAPTAAELAAQQLAATVAAAFAAGLTITSTSTPAINGTYAVDQSAQTRISAIETAILKNGAFPGSNGTQMAYPDISGKLTVFPSTALFSEFATAVADYVADLDLYAAGATGATLPSASVTIA